MLFSSEKEVMDMDAPTLYCPKPASLSQYVKIRSFGYWDYITPPRWRRLLFTKGPHRLKRTYIIDVHSSVNDSHIARVHTDDALWFLSEYNSYPIEQAHALLDDLHTSEREWPDVRNGVASEWTCIDAPVGFSPAYSTFLKDVLNRGINSELYCFGKPQKLQQYVLMYKKGVFGRRLQRPWIVAWHHERANLTGHCHFAEEAAACDYFLQAVLREHEYRKRFSPKGQ